MQALKTIILMGDPNVGKSVLFSRLTGVDVISANYPGSTVDYSTGRITRFEQSIEIIDAPGTYSLETVNKAEEVALSLMEKADVVINVVDATSLERCLPLTLELLGKSKPVLVVLNMWDEAQHLGVTIDVSKLETLLQVPVIPTVAITGEGIRELIDRLSDARISQRASMDGDDLLWAEVGHIVRTVQTVVRRHHTFRDRLVDATVKPGTGALAALVILFSLFWLVHFAGEGLIRFGFEPLFEFYRTPITLLADRLGPGVMRDALIGKLFGGQVDFIQSMGMLTTGLFVPFGMVLPYIIAFYLALALLEDTGYLPRLATVTDTFFHKFGMHGHGVIPVLLGLGCSVPGVLAVRTMETKKQRFISATLVSITVPCMAQSAMIFGILGQYGVKYISVVFGTLAAAFVILGLLLNRTTGGDCPELFLDIPPYRMPSLLAIAKKTWMRVRWFLAEAIPFLFLGVLGLNLLQASGLLDYFARLASPVMEFWLGLPGATATALVAGFLRKDLAVGMLVPLGLSPEQQTVAVTVLALYFPCAATLVVLLRELGIKQMLKVAFIMFLTALMAGGLLKLWLIQ